MPSLNETYVLQATRSCRNNGPLHRDLLCVRRALRDLKALDGIVRRAAPAPRR